MQMNDFTAPDSIWLRIPTGCIREEEGKKSALLWSDDMIPTLLPIC